MINSEPTDYWFDTMHLEFKSKKGNKTHTVQEVVELLDKMWWYNKVN